MVPLVTMHRRLDTWSIPYGALSYHASPFGRHMASPFVVPLVTMPLVTMHRRLDGWPVHHTFNIVRIIFFKMAPTIVI